MFGISDVELLQSIEPQLSWNTNSRVRHRAPRKPRTSFLVDSSLKSHVQQCSQNDHLNKKEPKYKEMSVSESEKLGVTILGHHFDGSLEGVPIKKRLLLAHSPSSSRGSPPDSSDITDNILECPGPHYVNRKAEQASSSGPPCDGADFSGISILAAAACSARFAGENMNSEPSVSKDALHVSSHKGPDSIGSHDEELSDTGVSDSKAGILEMPTAAEDGSCNDAARLSNKNTSCSDNSYIEDKKPCSTMNASRKNKLHWDLNKEMDAWEFPDDDDIDAIAGYDDDGVHNEKSNDGVCFDPVGNRVVLVEEVISSDIPKALKVMSIDTPTKSKMECSGIRNTTSPTAPNCSTQVVGGTSYIEELKSSNVMQSFGFQGKTDGSTKIFSHTCSKPAYDELCQVIDHAVVEEDTRDEVHDNNRISYRSMRTDIFCDDATTESARQDGESESIPTGFPACKSISPEKLVLHADCHRSDKMETVQAHSYPGCQLVVVAENCPSRETHETAGQTDFNAIVITADLSVQDDANVLNDAVGSAISANDTCLLADMVSSRVPVESLKAVAEKKNNGLEDLPSGQSMELDKIELHRDDDSQYEDGEFRESVLHEWGSDDDEYEDEHVDYGSDERENCLYEHVLVNPAPASPIPPVSRSCEQIVETSSENQCVRVACLVSKKGTDTKPQNLENPNSVVDARKVCQHTTYCTTVSGIRCPDHLSIIDGCLKQVDHSISPKQNSLGSNRRHVEPDCTADADMIFPVKDDFVDVPGAASTSESHKMSSEAMHSRNVLPHIDRDRPSEYSRSTDETCHLGMRTNKSGDTSRLAKIDRPHALFPRSVGSFHQEARSKGFSSNEALDQWIPNQRERHRYYGSPGYVQPAPKNAVEVAAAKVASNGFAVAPDGTVVEPGHLESNGWSSRRNASTPAQGSYISLARPLSTGRDRPSRIERDDALVFSSHSKHMISRGVSPERHLSDGEESYRHGPRMLSVGRKGKYSSKQVSGDRIDSLHCHRTISQKGHSPPSQRESNSSGRRVRSRSRSRTRSPHAWMSPTRNDGGRIIGHHGFRHPERFPSDFRSDVRPEPVKLSYRRASYVDRLDLVSPFREHQSQTSRAIQERKDIENNPRRHEYRVYRQSSERDPPEHPFSRGRRFDTLDSRRIDEDEYYRYVYPSRHTEFITAGKRTRADDHDDRRSHGGRFNMLVSPSSRQYAPGEMKHLRCNDGNGYRSENSRLKNGREFDDRDRDTLRSFVGGCEDQLSSPPRRSAGEKAHFRNGSILRGFVGGCEDQLSSSPRRSAVEKAHFRNGREVRQGANPKSSAL